MKRTQNRTRRRNGGGMKKRLKKLSKKVYQKF